VARTTGCSVGLTLSNEGVDQRVSPSSHLGFQPRNLSRREHRIENLPPFGVLGAIQIERNGDVRATQPHAFRPFGPKLADRVAPVEGLDVGPAGGGRVAKGCPCRQCPIQPRRPNSG
jgi:hypothetical protein